MTLAVHFPCYPGSGAPRGLAVADVRAVAAQVRHQIARDAGSFALSIPALLAAAQRVGVNGHPVAVAWDFAHPLHDDDGNPVLGMCQTDPAEPGCAYVSVNPQLTLHRPDLALSTAAHELGHVLFDVPAALESEARRYRAVAASAAALDRVGRGSEGRANEFMGALLAPPIALHTRLLACARSEGLRLIRAAHQGRPGAPVLAADNDRDAVSGVFAALAGEFGVSERFIAVRVARYSLMQGGLS